MNPKRLLLALFLLYWAGVVGVTFFSSSLKESVRKSYYRFFVPSGYNMFVPVTQTNFNVKYEFYNGNQKVGELNSWEYLDESGKSLFERKEIFLKKMVYFYRVSNLDHAFLNHDYDWKYIRKIEQPDSGFVQGVYLNNLVGKLKNVSEIFIHEDPKLAETDSVAISVRRMPIILPFQPDYEPNYSFFVGDTVFFQTYYLTDKEGK